MHYTLIFVTLSLFWTSLEATRCYRCIQRISEHQAVDPKSCAGGQFDKNNKALLQENKIEIRECPTGCSKAYSISEGIQLLTRSCNLPGLDGIDECNKVQLPGSTAEACNCQGDYCNGAESLSARQVIIGLATSVILTVVLTQY